MKENVSFPSDEAAMNTHFGAPLSEIVLKVEVGPCVECGAQPGEGGGTLRDAYVKDGVLYGDNVCSDCMPDPELLDDLLGP